MFEATLLTEKELATNIQEEGEVKDNSDINEGNEDTEVIDTMVEDELESQTQSGLSKAEMFYLGCTLKNPKIFGMNSLLWTIAILISTK